MTKVPDLTSAATPPLPHGSVDPPTRLALQQSGTLVQTPDEITNPGEFRRALGSWPDAAQAAFSPHFAGASLDTNYAHAPTACAESLQKIRVPGVS